MKRDNKVFKTFSFLLDVYVGIDNLGKEELLVDIAHAFHSLIVVSPERLKWIQL